MKKSIREEEISEDVLRILRKLSGEIETYAEEADDNMNQTWDFEAGGYAFWLTVSVRCYIDKYVPATYYEPSYTEGHNEIGEIEIETMTLDGDVVTDSPIKGYEDYFYESLKNFYPSEVRIL